MLTRARRAGALAAHAIRISAVLEARHEGALCTYGGVFLEFLEAAATARGRSVLLPHSSKAVDRSVMLYDVSPAAIMKVAAVMHFVRLKLARHGSALLQRAQASTADGGGRASAAGRFLIHGGANTDVAWLRKFGSVRSRPGAAGVCGRDPTVPILSPVLRGRVPRRRAVGESRGCAAGQGGPDAVDDGG